MNTVDKVISIATNEVWYLEKSQIAYNKNPNILHEKTAGAGQDNYTIYGKEMHDIYPQIMDFPAPWCDSFVDWCFYKAYGIATAKSLLNGNFDDYTVASCQMYQKHNALFDYPMTGDQVFFTKNGKSSGCYHTGIVYKVDGTYFYTIEGNTSNANDVISNGGGVAKKKYNVLRYEGKSLFGRPKYDVKSIEEIAKEVIKGLWGTGEARKSRLKNAGHDYQAVQNKVNELLNPKKPIEEIAREVIAGKWGTGEERKRRLTNAGYSYAEVQTKVNELLKPKKPTDTSKHIWDYLMSKINNPYGVAGLMGNLRAESNLNPKNLQNSYEKKLGITDDNYTGAVDNGTYTNFVRDSAGYGIAQWTYWSRKQGLLDYVRSKGVSIGDLDAQLEFLYKELTTSYRSVFNGLRQAISVREASDIVLTQFEKPKNQSEEVKQLRASYSQEYYDKYKR